MEIAYIHFYVPDSSRSRNWFIETMGFSFLEQSVNSHTVTESIGMSNVLFLISSPLNETSPVAHYLKKHPPGVADIAFLVENLDSFCQKLENLEIEIFENDLVHPKDSRMIKIKGWGSLEHTLIERHQTNPLFYENIQNHSIHLLETQIENKSLENSNQTDFIPLLPTPEIHSQFKPQTHLLPNNFLTSESQIINVDHVVLNVERHQLKSVVDWYKKIFNFHVQQLFTINTNHSGLYSEALIDSNHQVQFNINEPTSANSQIQEFLDLNHGSGIQHIALRTRDIFQTVEQMKNLGLNFLFVPPTYYQKLEQKHRQKIQSLLTVEQWQKLKTGQILLDFPTNNPQPLLMQIFTQPIFEQPTFFFELIERRQNAQGFGEGNFLALFEAIETQQRKKIS